MPKVADDDLDMLRFRALEAANLRMVAELERLAGKYPEDRSEIGRVLRGENELGALRSRCSTLAAQLTDAQNDATQQAAWYEARIAGAERIGNAYKSALLAAREEVESTLSAQSHADELAAYEKFARDTIGKSSEDALPALKRFAAHIGLPEDQAVRAFNRRMEKLGK